METKPKSLETAMAEAVKEVLGELRRQHPAVVVKVGRQLEGLASSLQDFYSMSYKAGKEAATYSATAGSLDEAVDNEEAERRRDGCLDI